MVGRRCTSEAAFNLRAETRFWSLVEKTEGGCWDWTGEINSQGYGAFTTAGGHSAHRYSWQIVHGPIPDDLEIHHRCENKRCVNPDHLEMLTPTEHRRLHSTPRPKRQPEGPWVGTVTSLSLNWIECYCSHCQVSLDAQPGDDLTCPNCHQPIQVQQPAPPAHYHWSRPQPEAR